MTISSDSLVDVAVFSACELRNTFLHCLPCVYEWVLCGENTDCWCINHYATVTLSTCRCAYL